MTSRNGNGNHDDSSNNEIVDGRVEVMIEFAKQAAEDGRFFFYVLIPENIGPLDRCSKYEDPLSAALEADNLGEVTGGGSQLGENNEVAFCGVDVEVTDRVRGLELIARVMQKQGAPIGTVIEEYLPTRKFHHVWFGA